MHRLRTVRLAALLVGLAMVAAACGGGDDEGGDTSGGSAQIQQGGTLNYAADQEPTGFNNNTSKDNGTSVLNIVISMFPFSLPRPAGLHGQDGRRVPRLGRADQRGPADDRLQDQGERDLVGRHADHAPTTSSTSGSSRTAPSRTTTSPRPPATTRSRASRAPTTARRSRSSSRTPSPTGRACSPASCPAHYVKERPGGWNTGLDKEPEKIPVGRLVQGRELHRRPEPDPGPQRQVLRAQGQPGLGGLPVPARVDHPAGRAAEQRSRPDLPPAPARPGHAGEGPARRDQRDQLRAVVRALRLQLQERAPRRPQGPPGDRHRHSTSRSWSTAPSSSSATRRPRSATASG